MKTTLSIVMLTGATALLGCLSGCSFAARSPDMYRDDTKAVIEPKLADIRACYDDVLKATPGVQGKVTVKFDVETEQGKLTNIAVDKANTTAPDAVAECVTKSLAGLGLTPADSRTGQATFTWEFAAPVVPSALGRVTPAPKS